MSVQIVNGTTDQIVVDTRSGTTTVSLIAGMTTSDTVIAPGTVATSGLVTADTLTVTNTLSAPGMQVSTFTNAWTTNPTVELSALTSDTGGNLSWINPAETPETYPPTFNAQEAVVSTGYNQGGFGSGSAGTQYTISNNTCLAFDTAQGGTHPTSLNFSGGVFDGRYIYMVPAQQTGSVITRYDTTQLVTSPNAYTYFDLSTVNAGFVGFGAGCFDGRYVYFAPYNTGGNPFLVQYDTYSSFTSSGSYAGYNLSFGGTFGSNLPYAGAVFDGRYVYLAGESSGSDSLIIQYDTTQPFNYTGAYAKFSTITANVNANTFSGGVFDGRYVYFPIKKATYLSYLRYDTTSSFTFASFLYVSVYDFSVFPDEGGFSAACFDGRYIYFIPAFFDLPPGYYDGQVFMRYDTTADPTVSGSYLIYRLVGLATGDYPVGAVYDGRYIYLGPNGLFGDTIVQYDTTKSFASSGSYVYFNTGGFSQCISFNGCVFDGKNVYYIPGFESTLLQHGAYHGPQSQNGLITF